MNRDTDNQSPSGERADKEAYLYHLLPVNLRGNILYPLNALIERFPDIYKRQVKKYAGREYLTRQRIPRLNCLWNDVLHLSPVSPLKIKQALITAGSDPNFTISCYRIDPTIIEARKAIVYLFTYGNERDKMEEKDFMAYNPSEIAEFSPMPPATIDYYRKMIGKGQWPLIYHRIPHILFKGTLNITDLPIVSA